MSINNCDIDLNTCEKSKKFKRSDIDEIARKCGINPNEYKSRKTLCEAIVAKNKGDVPHQKPVSIPSVASNNDCNISQNICEKSKKYNREDINSIAEKCGVENPKKFKSRKDLCMAILEKRGVKSTEEPKKPEEPKKTANVSPKCDKTTLENCLMKDLQIIAKEENIKNFSKYKKDELIKYIKQTRENRKNIRIVSEDEEEEPKNVEVPSDIEEEEIPIKPKKAETPKKQSPTLSKDCDKVTLKNCLAKDLKIIAKEENIKDYSKYKKDELIKYIEKIRKNRKVFDEEEAEVEEDEEVKKLPLTKKILKKVIKTILNNIGTYDIIEKRFAKFGELKKYILEQAKGEYNYNFDDESLKENNYSELLKNIITNMKEEYEEDNEPIQVSKKIDEEREQREREQREREQREREQREREQREREQREREQREREQREREQREIEQREREAREREQKEREVREREQKEREVREASKTSIEEDEDLFLEDLYIDVSNMEIDENIIDYMDNTLLKMNKQELSKIYKHIIDTKFNPNREQDMVLLKDKSQIILDIIEYIQHLSESFYDLYQSLGDKRYKDPYQTVELAINKYSKYDLQDLINTLYKRYPKNVVNNFETNMLKFFLKPWQKNFIKKKKPIELPKGDIEDVLNQLQKSEISDIAIDKLYEVGVPIIETTALPSPTYVPPESPTLEPSDLDIYKIGDEVQIIETKEHGKVMFTRKLNGEEVLLVKILPDGITKTFTYEEIKPIDYIEEEEEEIPSEKEIIEDLEEKEAERIRKLKEIEKKTLEDEEQEQMRLKIQEEERQKRIQEEEARLKEKIELLQEEERLEEEKRNKVKIQYDNIDTLLSEIQKRNVEDVDNIDIVNNQVLKCLGLIA